MVYEELQNKVINNLSKKHLLTYADKTFIIQNIQNVPYEKLKHKNVDELVNLFSEVFSKKIIEKKDLDMHEYLKTEIGVNSEHTVVDKKVESETVESLLNKPKLLQSIFNPNSLIKKAYLFLDSKYRVRNTDSNTLKWNIATTGTNYDERTTAVSTSRLKNIVAIKLYPFKFPNTYGSLYNFNRIYVDMVELNNQSYIMYGNNRFHFEFNITYVSQPTLAQTTGYRFIPSSTGTDLSTYYTQAYCDDVGQNKSIFEFTYPIAELTTLSLQFNNGIQVLNMDADTLKATLYTNRGTRTALVFASTPYIALYDTISLSGVTTTDVSATTVINNINTEFMITEIDGVNVDNLVYYYIEYDTSGILSSSINNGVFDVYLNSKRLQLRLELDYMVE